MFTIYKDISISYFESIISSDPIFMAQTQFVVSEGHNIVKVIEHYGCLRLATITIHSNRTDTTFIMLQSTYIVDNYDWRPQHLKDMASVHIYSYQLLRRDEKITANTNILCHKIKKMCRQRLHMFISGPKSSQIYLFSLQVVYFHLLQALQN